MAERRFAVFSVKSPSVGVTLARLNNEKKKAVTPSDKTHTAAAASALVCRLQLRSARKLSLFPPRLPACSSSVLSEGKLLLSGLQ